MSTVQTHPAWRKAGTVPYFGYDKADTLQLETGEARLMKTDILKGLMFYTVKGSGIFYPISLENVKMVLEMNANGKKPADITDLAEVEEKTEEESIEEAIMESVKESLDSKKESKDDPKGPDQVFIIPLNRRPFFPGMAAPVVIEPGPFYEVLKVVAKKRVRGVIL